MEKWEVIYYSHTWDSKFRLEFPNEDKARKWAGQQQFHSGRSIKIVRPVSERFAEIEKLTEGLIKAGASPKEARKIAKEKMEEV